MDVTGRIAAVADADDEGSWSRTLTRLVNDAALRVNIGRAGREHVVQFFSEGAMLAALESKLQNLTAGRSTVQKGSNVE